LDDVLVGDGAAFTQVKATLRTTANGAALSGKFIQWATTIGTIKPISTTNSLGETRDTLRTDLVENDIVATFRGTFGPNVFDAINVTFLAPRDSALVLGWEIEEKPSFPVEGIGDLIVTAILANSSANPIEAERVDFWLSENVFGIIGPPVYKHTDSRGRAVTRISYPYQFVGSVVRVWAKVFNNPAIRGYVDITLPEKPGEEEEEEEG
jgi:hypothetical protein